MSKKKKNENTYNQPPKQVTQPQKVSAPAAPKKDKVKLTVDDDKKRKDKKKQKGGCC